LVGSELCGQLVAAGDRVLAHSRTPDLQAPMPGVSWLGGDLTGAGDWQQVLAEADAVVHLAGAPIAARRWNPARKRELRDSRILSTRQIAQALAQAPRRPRVFVCASATGFYGARGDEPLDESSLPGDDFLARLCVEWEAAAGEARQAGVRVATVRFGAVLSRRGGVLARMWPLFRWGLGGPLGPADRYFPWIHEADAAGLVRWILAAESGLAGALNAVAPESLRMGDWTRLLAAVAGRPARLPVPGFALRLALGELGAALVPGQRIAPRAALAGGYVFSQPELAPALEDLLA
jgi:uncharacterized protein (TIGR01777 family)